jgi:hypothetical protein
MRLVHRIPLLIAFVCWATVASAAEPPELAEARTLYNAANYDGAIELASVARVQPQWADAAALVIARAHLERYRHGADPADLSAAREALRAVHSASLMPRDQVDLLIGLGQALYLGEIYGAAAELFDTALSRSVLISGADRLMLLDWWATALDREAQSRPAEGRARVFDRLTARMEEELRQDPASWVANYWLAVAARGAGDMDRAWAAAVAAWVRSGLAPASTERLRMDLDRLVTQALIPERARTRPAREQQDATAAFQADWDLVKQQWK